MKSHSKLIRTLIKDIDSQQWWLKFWLIFTWFKCYSLTNFYILLSSVEPIILSQNEQGHPPKKRLLWSVLLADWRTDGRDGRMDGRMDGRTDRQTDRLANGWTEDQCLNECRCLRTNGILSRAVSAIAVKLICNSQCFCLIKRKHCIILWIAYSS